MKLTILLASLLSTTAFAGTELKLNSGTISTSEMKISLNENLIDQTEWIVQFKDKVTEKIKTQLQQNGVTIYSYLPEDALIVRADYRTAKYLKTFSNIQAVLAFEANMKMSPTLEFCRRF